MTPYPKRLIEVDLPIARISAHARREKSIRHGHISTLHIWWARRPLAACRAVILASLWPDPVDLAEWGKETDAKGEVRAPKGETLKPGEGVVIRPRRFLDEARQRMNKWAQIGLSKASQESYSLLVKIQKNTKLLDDPEALRTALLDFIADFADWDHSTDKDYLDTSRALVQAAHEALGGEVDTRPMVIDPFAGGGSIPLEALRVGADAFASDLNPIPVLLNKVVLEYLPKYGQRLASEVQKWGQWIHSEVSKELAPFYPTDKDGALPIAYLWARTILSEAPGQGDIPIEVPLMRSMWLTKKHGRRRALRWVRDSDGKVKTHNLEVVYFVNETPVAKRVRRPVVEMFEPTRDSEVESGTVAKGSATCPVTGFTTPVASVRSQLKPRTGGSFDSRLMCCVYAFADRAGKEFRLPNAQAVAGIELARQRIVENILGRGTDDVEIPTECINPSEPRRIPIPLYGMTRWYHLFNPRQLWVLVVFSRCLERLKKQREVDPALREAVLVVLALSISKIADRNSTLCRWISQNEAPGYTFGRQALPMLWDYAESAPLNSGGGWEGILSDNVDTLREQCVGSNPGTAQRASADERILPDNSVDLLCTDPPYYYSIPYAHLSDFFYVWLRRLLRSEMPSLLADSETDKKREIVQNLPHKEVAAIQRTREDYEKGMNLALTVASAEAKPGAIGVVVFAHTETAAWESLLAALVDAEWCVTGSWPIDTEREARIIAQRQSTLASSVHLVCRPRRTHENGTVTAVGEWRDVLAAMPKRIHEWMPRLAAEGVVGADAIFACLGPALEVFSRFDRVEKASGDAVSLREYLEHVWAAVSAEALSMIFKDADAAGLEPDARLTAMWLWTLGGGQPHENGDGESEGEVEIGDGEDDGGKKARESGFVLEYDAARKIAQGLGVNLEKSESIVAVKGDSARLLPASERARYLFGKDADEDPVKTRKAKKKAKQGSLFEELDAIEAEAASTGGRFGGLDGAKPGATVLDKVHQSMILFAAGRGEALKRFLVEDGVGKEGRFWKLAQSLSALYPSGTDEKRWVDGVLARKKGLGF